MAHRSRRPAKGDGSTVQLGGEQLGHTTEVTASQLLALTTPRGLMLRGPGGVVMLTNRTLPAVAEFAIALQDIVLSDPDLEANGDELDGSMGEDEFCLHSTMDYGAGCPVADPGGCEHDGSEPEGQ